MNHPIGVNHDQQINTLPHAATSTSALVLDGESLDRMMKLAEIMATGKATLPAHIRGNSADCLAIVMQSMQWQMNPFAVAQKTHFVNGVLGYEAQLVNAVITSRAPVRDRLNYDWFGNWERVIGRFEERESRTKKDDYDRPIKYRVPAWKAADEEGLGVKVWATFHGEDKPRELTLLLTQARTRNSTLWADDPRQQLAYLAVKRWARLYCPDVILGVYSTDELDSPQERDMGLADIVPPTKQAMEPQQNAPQDPPEEGKPPYPDEKMAEGLPLWKARIDGGKTSAGHLIATISSKFTLSAGQIEQIEALEIVDAEMSE